MNSPSWTKDLRDNTVVGYTVALLSVLATLVLTFFLGDIAAQIPFTLSYTAVAFSAWFGGLGPGLFATFVAGVAAAYFFLPPSVGAIDLTYSSNLVRLGTYIFVALFINILSYSRTVAIRQASSDRARFFVTLTSIGDAVIATDTQGRITFMNPVAESLTGWKLAEARGVALSVVFNAVDAETRAAVESPFDAVIATGAVAGLANNAILVARDGTERPVDDSGAPIRDERGNLRGVVLVLRDVSERRRAERETVQLYAEAEDQRAIFDTIIRGLPIGVAYFDTDFRVLTLNDEWARLNGVDAAGVQGSRLFDVVPATRERRDAYEAALRGESVDLQSIPYNDAGGNRCGYRDLFMRPVFDADGDVVGAISATIDVTERHTLDQQKDALMALASHELKTPITGIKAYSQLGLRSVTQNGDEKMQRILRIVDDQANRLTRLINEMLDVSRLQTESLPLHTEDFDLAVLVREVVGSHELTSPEFKFDLRVGPAPLNVHADRQRIEQVVTNLLQNAVKYSGESRRVEVVAGIENNEAAVTVRDFGVGIPADQIEHIFERFFRARNVATRNYSGLGLGLYISHSIIARHVGHMWCESVEGEGSTFGFALPLAPVESAPEAQAAAPSSESAVPAAQESSVRLD